MKTDSDLFDVLMNEDDYIRENVVTLLPTVHKCIKTSKDDAFVLRAIDISTKIFLEYYSIEEYEENIFKQACPAAKTIFWKTLKGIENVKPSEIQTQSDFADTYFNLLSICMHIIESFYRAYQCLSDLEKIAVNNVRSLVESTAEIIYYTYEHCKISEKLYGDYFDRVTDILKRLYKNTTELQGLYLVILTKQIQFNCDLDEELESLDKILIYLYKSSSSLSSLDVKNMVELWKAYLALCGKFSEMLKNHHNIAEPIRYLCDNILENLEEVLSKENKDKGIIVKNLKISCFLLKLVIKFCEIFNGHIGDCNGSLVNLLIFLCKYNQSFMEFSSIPNEVITEFTKQISIGSEPLLSHLLSDKGIVRQFSRVADDLENTSDLSFGFLLLCCSVSKKLMNSDVETRRLWVNGNDNILDWMFLSLNFCQWELISNIKFQSVLIPGRQKRLTDLYEYVLVHATAFLLTSSPKEFPNLEKILFKNILQTNPWPAILAMDVWCVLARFADADLCYSQLAILSKILAKFPVESYRPEKIYLTCLVQRLFPLMIQRDQDNFVKLFPVSENSHLWAIFGVINLSPTYRVPLEHQLHQSAAEKTKKFMDYGNFFNFNNLEKSLFSLSQIFQVEKNDLLEQISNLWKFDVSESISKLFLERYLKALAYATYPALRLMSTVNLLTILSQMKKILSSLPSNAIQLYCMFILRQLSTITISAGSFQQTIIKTIASSFNDLLTSENLFVKQKTLEIFAHFAQVTKHPEIVGLSIGNNVSLQSDVTNYLKKNLKQEWDADVFFKKENINYLHVCEEEEENYEPVTRKPRLDDVIVPERDFQAVVNRLKSDSKIISECFDLLSNSQKREIKDIHDCFVNMIRRC